MQPVEIGHRQEHLTRECLQAAAGITGAVAPSGLAHTIGDAALQFLETGILATDALAGYEAYAPAALFDRRDQVGQEHRVVLAVAVERRHDRTARRAYAAAHGGRLT